MGKSAGPGSPVFFHCAKFRREGYKWRDSREHVIELTGRSKPYYAGKSHALGQRSSYKTREYRCSCGHVGWSNHVDLARMAGEDKRDR